MLASITQRKQVTPARIALVLCGLFLCGFQTSCVRGNNSTQARLEQMARSYGLFSREFVIRNQDLRMDFIVTGSNTPGNWKPGANGLVAEQQRLVKDLRESGGNRKTLEALLGHPDPKVRTLALGAIFLRQDGRDLPMIARLIKDEAQTFSNLNNSASSGGGPWPLSVVVHPQSVGDVAQAMLTFWGVPATGQKVTAGGRIEKVFVTADDFAAYWKKYAGRQYSASWFTVKMNRATGRGIPIQPKRRPEIQRVLAEMKRLPMPDRAWIQLYVLAPEGWIEHEPADLIVNDGELIAMIKKLSPQSLLHFLQRQKISEDPDLLLDKDNSRFGRMSAFILRHADLLLRPEDADALLACGYVQRESGGVSPAWAVGAALVQPARAGEILRHALGQETRNYATDPGMLSGALWRIRGPAEMDFLVDWFYQALPSSSEPWSLTVAFLWEVEAASRPDTKQLIAALVNDLRFDQTDWATLKEMLVIVNAGRRAPLVPQKEIYDAMRGDYVDQRIVFANWRNLLRHDCGLPQKTPPIPESAAKQDLTQPLWSVPLAGPPSLIVSSLDGQWLATLAEGSVTIWKAADGKLWWQIPRDPTEAAFCMAFEKDEQRLLVFDRGEYGRFREWNITTRQEIGKVLLTGKPTSGVDEGAYGLDREARRAAFSGYGDLVCFDTHSGKPLWSHAREGGVRSLAALSSDGTRLAAGGGSENLKGVRVYDAASGKVLHQFDLFASPLLALALSSDGRELATASTADGVQLWDTVAGRLSKALAYRVPNWGADAMVLSFDDQWLAVVGASPRYGETKIGIFRVSNGELEWEIPSRKSESIGRGTPLAFAPDGKVLYTGTQRLEAWSLN